MKVLVATDGSEQSKAKREKLRAETREINEKINYRESNGRLILEDKITKNLLKIKVVSPYFISLRCI